MLKKKQFLLILSFFLFSDLLTAQKVNYDEEFQIQTDNDILTFKRKLADRYYSFGIHLDYRKLINNEAKLFSFVDKHRNNLQKVIVNWHAGIEGYTSDKNRDLQVDGVFVAFDRPYAGWLFAENTITSVTKKNIIYLKTTIGVLGPASGADKLQNNFHNLINSPHFEEWSNQIQNEVAINIGTGFNTPLVKYKRFDIHNQTSISLGTQATYFRQGIVGRFGKFNTLENTTFYNTNLAPENRSPESEFFLDFGAFLYTWGYKATVQGRLFGENINMKTDSMHRVNVDVSAAINFSMKKFTAFFRHHLITAETSRGRHFYYGSIGLIFKM